MKGKQVGIWFLALMLITPCAGLGVWAVSVLVSIYQFNREENTPDYSISTHISGWSIHSSMPTVALIGIGVMVLLMFFAGISLLVWNRRENRDTGRAE